MVAVWRYQGTLALLVLLSACATTHRVTRITPRVDDEKERLSESAVFYALPQTAVVVDIELTRQQYKAGRCGNARQLAERLDIKPDALVTQNGSRFAWGKLSLSSEAQPDPDNIFAIEVDPKFLQRRTQLVELTEQGLLMGASSEATSQAAEVAVKLLEFSAGIAGTAVGFGGGTKADFCSQVADDIEALRDDQRKLVGGKTTTFVGDRSALELMLSKLNASELRLLGEFTGIPKRTVAATVRCSFAPGAKYGPDSEQLAGFTPTLQKDLLTLSQNAGVVSSSPECIVPGDFKQIPGETPRERATLMVQVVETASPVADAVATYQETPPHSGGLFYRVPGRARLTLFADGQVQQDVGTSIAQYGVVSTLPGPVVRAYTAKYDAKVYPDSGAMKTLNTSSTSVDTASLAAANTAVQPLEKALVDREKARQAAADEVNQATRERTLLQEQERIRCLMEGRYPECP